MVLTAQFTSISHWVPLQDSGLTLILYAAYSGGQLRLQDLKRHRFLIPALVVLGMQYPALSESISVQHGVAIFAIYAFYNKENLDLRNIEASPILVLLAVLGTQIEPNPGSWTIGIAFYLMYQGKNGEDDNKFSLPFLIGAALAVPTLSLPQTWAATAQIQKLVLFLAAYIFYHADTAATAEALVAFQTITNRVVGFAVGIACYMPIHHGLPLQFQVWTHCLAIGVVVMVGYFSSPTKFCGPARYGYINYSRHFAQLYSVLCDWWVYAVFFVLIPACLPFLGFGVIATAMVTWVVVWREYSRALTDITDKACVEVSRASLAEELAREYASTADRYRKQMLETVAVARRDAFLAQSVRATDFFDCTAKAWAALGEVVGPVDDMVKKAEETIDAAQMAENAAEDAAYDEEPSEGNNGNDDDDEDDDKDDNDEFDGGNGGPATELFKSAMKAKKKAAQIRDKLTAAQETIRFSEAANEQHEKSRVDAKNNADSAVSAAKMLEEKLLHSTREVSAAVTYAARVKTLAARATVVATDGDMATAQEFLNSAKSAADNVERSKEKLLSVMNSARIVLLGYMGIAQAEETVSLIK
ncbi:hypothetical protein TWF730_006207 [Orbilia blumenaviensis]|uniref:Uncharacterized protein n=1 Tax=Orbilia blumenaviensis TaxID=1796055 RepID=A0AAV9VE43_9PEZI